jgi:hypothetical protein
VRLDDPDLAQLGQRAKSLVDDFGRDPSLFDKAGLALRKEFWDPLELLPGRIEQALRADWVRYVDDRVGTGNRPVVDVLGRLPDRLTTCQELIRIYDASRSLANGLPSEDAFKTVANEGVRAGKLFAKLGGADLPEAVFKFLERATAGEAAFAEVNAEIRDWLAGNGLLGRLKVRF